MKDDSKAIADAKHYARQAIGDAMAAGFTPPIERTHKPSADVEHMRQLAAAGTTEEST